jgi:hypothetical protein
MHALIFLLLLYTRMQQRPEKLFPPARRPAKVQLERSSSHYTKKLAAQPEEDQVDQNRKKIVQKAPLEETISDKIEQSINSSPSQERSSDYKDSGKSSSKASAPSHTVSREAFMRAFNSAVHQGQTGHATQSSPEELKVPSHVKERLKEWGEYHYREKLYNALRRASKFAATTMHHERSLEKMVQITITIKKDGTLGILSTQKLSGIKEVDEHLLKVLHSADFPPIPDRFGIDTFVFTLPIRISLKAGSGIYRLFV